MTAIQPLFSELEPMPKASADAPIGIFDSGIGGMSVAAEIAKYLPNEHIVYYADTAYVPYGPRSDEEIRELTARAVDWLYRQGCKIAVVACNTASAKALRTIQQNDLEKMGKGKRVLGVHKRLPKRRKPETVGRLNRLGVP